MKPELTFENPENISNIDILEVEKATDIKLPNNLREFFLNYASASPKLNGEVCWIDIIHDDGWKGRDSLKTVESPRSIQENWKHRTYLKEFQDHFELSNDYVEAEKLFPLIEMYDSELNIAIGGKHDGKIYYVDNGDFGIIYVAESLSAMLDMVYSELTER